MVERIEAHFERYGFGLWAVEVRQQSSFIGFVGLAVPSFEAHFTPCVEVGWRLAQQNWGLGYATEAARAAVTFGFGQLSLEEIVSFTVPEIRQMTSITPHNQTDGGTCSIDSVLASPEQTDAV